MYYTQYDDLKKFHKKTHSHPNGYNDYKTPNYNLSAHMHMASHTVISIFHQQYVNTIKISTLDSACELRARRLIISRTSTRYGIYDWGARAQSRGKSNLADIVNQTMDFFFSKNQQCQLSDLRSVVLYNVNVRTNSTQKICKNRIISTLSDIPLYTEISSWISCFHCTTTSGARLIIMFVWRRRVRWYKILIIIYEWKFTHSHIAK